MFDFLHNEFQTQYRDQMLRKLHEICKFVIQCYTPCSFPPHKIKYLILLIPPLTVFFVLIVSQYPSF